MSQNSDDKHRKHIDALEALARGRQSPPDEAPEADSSLGPSSGLMLLSEGEEETGAGEDFLQDFPGEPDAEPPAALGDLAAASAEAAGGGGASLGDVAAVAGEAAKPAFQAQRATRLHASVRRSHAQAYKRTMIPLLLAVGALLFVLSAVTLVMLLSESAQEIAGGMTYMQAYGKYFVVAALPLGAILLMGAWLFYVDVKSSESRTRK